MAEPVITEENPVTPKTDLEALFNASRECHEPRMQAVTKGTEQEASVLIIPKGMNAVDVKPYLDKYRKVPERPTGTSIHQTLASIIEHAKNFRTHGTAAWGEVIPSAPSASLLVVYDYHLSNDAKLASDLEPGDVGARWNQFGASYAFPLAPEFIAWKAQNGKAMTQAEMSAFLEDHLAEVCSAEDAGERAVKLSELLETKLASASTLLGFARKSAAVVNCFVSEKRNPTTGAVELIYQEEVNHQTEDREKITPPGVFAIRVPVLQGGIEYRLAVRLKSAVSGRAIKWTVEVYRIDVAFIDAVNDELARFASETGLTVYRGRYANPSNGSK